jgi:hypothetical protein
MVMTAMSFVLTAAVVVTVGNGFLMITMFRMICVILMRHGGCVTAVVTAAAVVTMGNGFLMITMFRMICAILMRHGGCVRGVVCVLT